MNALQNINRLTVAIQAGQPLPDDVGVWVQDGIELFIKSRGKVPLCRCLGISGQGKLSFANQILQAERDRYLRIAWNSVALVAIDDWSRSKRLAKEISYFEKIDWPLYCNNTEIKTPNEVKKNLFLAYKVGIYVPTSARQIHRLVT